MNVSWTGFLVGACVGILTTQNPDNTILNAVIWGFIFGLILDD